MSPVVVVVVVVSLPDCPLYPLACSSHCKCLHRSINGRLESLQLTNWTCFINNLRCDTSFHLVLVHRVDCRFLLPQWERFDCEMFLLCCGHSWTSVTEQSVALSSVISCVIFHDVLSCFPSGFLLPLLLFFSLSASRSHHFSSSCNFMQPFLSLFLCLCILPSGLVKRLLSSPLWLPLSRISFQIYLVHFTVINFHFLTQKKPLPFTHYDRLFMSCGILLLSVGGALCTYCLFEAPFSYLVKKLIIDKKVNKKEDTSTTTIDDLVAPADSTELQQAPVRVITVLKVACWDRRSHDRSADHSHLCSLDLMACSCFLIK